MKPHQNQIPLVQIARINIIIQEECSPQQQEMSMEYMT